MSSSVSRSLVLAAALVALPAAARAQAAEPAAVTRPQVLSIQPLGIPALFFSGEYERAVSPNATIGVGGSYFGPDELSYTSMDVKARFYPTVALKGFAIGATAGYTRVSESYSDEFCDPAVQDCEDVTRSGATVGVQLDYQWLLGKQSKYAVALGAGMKRIFVNNDEFDDFSAFYPTVRASFGIAY